MATLFSMLSISVNKAAHSITTDFLYNPLHLKLDDLLHR